MPELVHWNRTYLAHLAGDPLDDARCRVVIGDVFDTVRRSPEMFDVILLDVDNGPQALARAKNQQLYGDVGVRACHAALRPKGILAVWSRGPNAKYQRRLERLGFEVEMMSVAVRIGSQASHVIFLARRG